MLSRYPCTTPCTAGLLIRHEVGHNPCPRWAAAAGGTRPPPPSFCARAQARFARGLPSKYRSMPISMSWVRKSSASRRRRDVRRTRQLRDDRCTSRQSDNRRSSRLCLQSIPPRIGHCSQNMLLGHCRPRESSHGFQHSGGCFQWLFSVFRRRQCLVNLFLTLNRAGVRKKYDAVYD